MNALLNYPGAKWGMADFICSILPPHHSYLEPFFGSGAVLFRKPASHIETVNDINGDVVNFFSVVRDCPEELAYKVQFTPYSREMYEYSWEYKGDNPVERAYTFLIRNKMSYGYKTSMRTGFKIDRQGRERSYSVRYWNALPEDILTCASRLKQVQIERTDALEIITKFNFKNVCIYADPPYLPSARYDTNLYECEMSEQDHVSLLEALLQHKGSVILSGYPSDLYAEMLKGWNMISQKSYNQNADRRTECIWCNFELPQQSFFDRGL